MVGRSAWGGAGWGRNGGDGAAWGSDKGEAAEAAAPVQSGVGLDPVAGGDVESV